MRISCESRTRPSVTSPAIPAFYISRAIKFPMVAVREVLPPATTSTVLGAGGASITLRTARLSS